MSDNRIQIHCPACSAWQSEPRLIQSTYCRSCGRYLKIEAGEVIDPSKPASLPKLSKTDRIRALFQPTESDGLAPLPIAKSPPSRQIDCFDCGRSFEVPLQARSSNCPHCSAYVSLEDILVDGVYAREIQTRGNVEVMRKASAGGISIRCKDLLVKGLVTGPVEATGTVDVQIRGDLTVTEVVAEALVVGKNSHLIVKRPIRVKQAEIHGRLTGQLECSGAVTLSRKSKVSGDISMGSISIEDGAVHEGQVRTRPSTATTGASLPHSA